MFLKIKKILQTTLLITSLSCITSYAKEVTFSLDAPEGFNKKVEIYLNQDPHPIAPGDTEMTLNLKEKVYDVFVMSSNDISESYSFSYPETLDVSTTDHIDIKVTDISAIYDELIENEQNHEHLFDDSQEELQQTIEPMQYDFSEEGKASATIHVQGPFNAAFKSVTYQFIGEHVYNIKLDRDHNFEAYAILPVGKYYETETVNAELDEDANAGHVFFIWTHGADEEDCHKYYTLNEGDTLEINDIKIMMVGINGDVYEANSKLLFSEKLLENYKTAVDNHVERTLQEQFPEDYKEPTIAIAEAKPKEEKETFNYTYIIIGAVILIVIAGTVVLFIKKKSEDED